MRLQQVHSGAAAGDHRTSETLVDHPPGVVLVVQRVEAESADALRLKRLGICEGRRVQIVSGGDPLVLRVVGTRIGLSRRLGLCVHARPCEHCAPDADTGDANSGNGAAQT